MATSGLSTSRYTLGTQLMPRLPRVAMRWRLPTINRIEIGLNLDQQKRNIYVKNCNSYSNFATHSYGPSLGACNSA
ncbi:Vanillin dehydrogenase [Fusarium oxysporum f. sp. albedinis]|nr:Vanillin dehydrogenase [Fusarium oxysporum f. sp. albedinis]